MARIVKVVASVMFMAVAGAACISICAKNSTGTADAALFGKKVYAAAIR